ncbi:site-specific integrase [Nocardia amamiensis]|uniref:Site-specific integrase n=1 Tax=Nocardia amamiensis TaxID=404578 RepID=A0ABS0D1G0_9NOCA|nr:site-specific integrase [Nocardia amamiensis]MBF6302667.1 site-specific integrase [Nocardia amamiensis]
MTITTIAASPHTDWTSDKAERTRSTRGLLAETVMAQFPTRPSAAALDEELTVDEAVDRADEPQFRSPCESTRFRRRRGTRALLRWLANYPGDTWQQRWQASGAEAEQKNWTAAPLESLAAQDSKVRKDELCSGLIMLAITRVIHLSPAFLLTMTRTRHWVAAVGEYRDPAGFAHLRAEADAGIWESGNGFLARWQIAILILAKGGGVRDITVGDCLELRQLDITMGLRGQPRYLFYALLHSAGIFPPGAPATLRGITTFGGQYSIERLIDRYQLANREIRDLLVSYLAERQAALDYGSLEDLARTLGLHFWKNLETHHPGIDSLHLAPEVARAWKERLRTRVQRKRRADGTVIEAVVPRVSYFQLATVIRAFYLDIAQWAMEDPVRWGRWAVPSPISGAEVSYRKILSRRKARMDQRTRDRLPLLPALVQTAERRAEEARIRLDAALATAPHQTFTVLGETFTKTSVPGRLQRHKAVRQVMGVIDPSGRRRNLRAEENRAFWAWAAVELLRHTGARIEEMLETSHHSITQYRLPTTGEIIPLLHIAPSKTDEERLLVISPELADVLSTIIARVRQKDGTIPSVPFYDTAERVWAAPAPLLFQWDSAGNKKVIASSTIRKGIKEIFEATDLKDTEGEPLYFQPHDLRRIVSA